MYHSPLEFRFQGQVIKGFPELLILGDTRSGKTQVADRISKHYRAGAIATGEGANFVGLFGGLAKERDKWVVRWGKIPMNHKRLLFIDEVSGLSLEDISLLSQIRSSGIAELTKINSEKTQAKTRLIWQTNPRGENAKDNRKVNGFSSGVEAIQELIGKPEDIARFDFAIIVAEDDIDYDRDVNIVDRATIPHIHTSDHCHNLVLWAWSRTKEQVLLSHETVEACFEYAKEMTHKYSSDFPLVNPSEQKIKLARLATGLACRLFSTDSTGECVVVTPKHVQFVFEFLNEEYDRPLFGYAEWSGAARENRALFEPEQVWEILKDLGVHIVRSLLKTRTLRLVDLEEMTGRSREEVKVMIARLIKHRALDKPYSCYYKTPAFTVLLKQFMANPETKPEEF